MGPPPSPDLFAWLDDHKTSLEDTVFQSYTDKNEGHQSYWFQYQDFIHALRLMSGVSDGDVVSRYFFVVVYIQRDVSAGSTACSLLYLSEFMLDDLLPDILPC